ncbi:asparaginyl-tRNA synthetase-like [Littorina saxatilis]|uniref:asparagine--tRNA ligase n=1 Tax=Littorina saxatilis TaxID=31220 RepID=A0AAN9B2Y1_9CAEN
MAAPMRRSMLSCFCRASSVYKQSQHPKYTGTASKQNISTILQDETLCGSTISISGWVKSVRQHKDNVFLHISDGSGPKHLQIIASTQNLPESVTFASCVRVQGELKESPARGQSVELVADSISLLGACDNTTFPFGARHKHSAEYCRDFLHLRPKTDSFASLLRLRSAATAAFHSYFQKEGYLYVQTPILTSNDCEGGGEVFAAEPAYGIKESAADSGSDSEVSQESQDGKKHFFSNPAFLTVSGQLHLEAVASAVSKVYNFGPTFRAENSRGRHHLSEFYMVEAEVAFLHSLDQLIQIMEDMVQETCQQILTHHQAELDFYLQRLGTQKHKEFLERVVRSPFARLTYTEAVQLLEKHNHRFKHQVKWGDDLKKEHEKYLTQEMGDVPVFVTDFPAELKPFYAKANQDDKTVAAVDLLVPGVGELIGGSLREDDLDLLTCRLRPLGIEEQYRWYTELCQFGSSPHGGFGLGFERYLQFILATPNIKDTVPFPRWSRHCQL